MAHPLSGERVSLAPLLLARGRGRRSLMNSFRRRRGWPVVLAASAVTLTAVLTACGSRTTMGAVLHPGDSASLRLFGPPVAFELTNIGGQPLEYTLFENGVETSQGAVAPGGGVLESRHAESMLVVITNPGPGLARASIEAKGPGGMQFHQSQRPAAPGL